MQNVNIKGHSLESLFMCTAILHNTVKGSKIIILKIYLSFYLLGSILHFCRALHRSCSHAN